MSEPFKLNDRVRVTDGNNGNIDPGTIIKVWPQYVSPDEPRCYDIKLEKNWSGAQPGQTVLVIGRSDKSLSKA